MKSWYRFNRQNSGEIKLYLYDDIGRYDIRASHLIEEIKNIDAQNTIHVHINSLGGEIGEGIAICNALIDHPSKVITCVDSYALSIASVIAMAGDERRMRDNALMMIHDPNTICFGEASDMRKEADILDKHKSIIVNTYLSVTGITLTDQQIRDAMSEETWYEAEEALTAGLITHIDSSPNDEHEPSNNLKLSAKNLPDYKNAPKRFYNIFKQINPVTTNQPHGETNMPKPATTSDAPDENDQDKTMKNRSANMAEFRNIETKRREAINKAFSNFNDYTDLRDKCLDDMDVTVEDARERLLHAMGNRSPGPTGAEPSASAGDDESDKFTKGCINALLSRAGLQPDDKRNNLRGLSLMDMARQTAEDAGVSTRGLDKRNIVANAFTQSTSDFPVILEDTVNKVLLKAYATASDKWRLICDTGSVSDFKDYKRLRLGSFGNLDNLNENGEYKYKQIPDASSEKIAADTKGNLIAITRKMIINDDLDAFVKLAKALARSAGRSIETDVFTLLNSNAKMSDNVALFHNSHKNLLTAGAITTNNIEAARVVMAKQKDLSGNDFLDISPSILLVPTHLGGLARTVMSSKYHVADKTDNTIPNAVKDLATVVDSPRLNGDAWYLLADPNDAPIIEVVFLDGVQEPFLDQEESFTSDGVTYKVRLDYGVGVVDSVGAVKNPGA